MIWWALLPLCGLVGAVLGPVAGFVLTFREQDGRGVWDAMVASAVLVSPVTTIAAVAGAALALWVG